MKKSILFVCAVTLSLAGIVSAGYADTVELIDHLSIEKIVSVEVRPLFIITKQSFIGLRGEKVPENILSSPNLQALTDQKFDGREVFVAALEQALGTAVLHQKVQNNSIKTLLLRHAKQHPSSRSSYYLDVVVDILNNNDIDLKLTECTFDFFIHDEEAIGEMTKIGTDEFQKGKEIYLTANPTSEAGKVAHVKFEVAMGTDKNAVFDTVAHLLNFIGNPKDGDYLFINGRFNLGMKSKKGWTYGEAIRVDWMFCPTMQQQLPLSECFVK
ncbi:hypothetical protein CSB45_02930 [candidate division KSB3 bacterium]|uniref:Uncharacterized protein n=1 Tax=candidate division KSB3 bacterium TaxID=2044937 RepID=A0A2G6E8X7_9BACT|nr:MAG: hypothetical protein CSB45_02930 [candidate division KSB3 bacterium]PIE29007.1 MAG: hypothetical protein CSA57_11150 [candidate division KSB3 bacterium]